jgi:hypothetical protein
MFVISEEPGRNGHHDSFLVDHIELLQGTNNVKKVMEVYTEDSTERPLFAVIETPGTGNVFRIVNTATVKLPLSCNLELFLVEEGSDDMIVTNEVANKVVRMVNSATVAFAISCNSDPFLVGAEGSDDMFVISEEPGRNGH